ncbi:hypothetical protein mRhiFer1_003420 [Rhinolophus ferrumequinum]|uniref:Alpha-S2-casein n=1 Tax=Rhinolophus ferrumequinum TaxID=59479 RepID=A0A7J7ZD42_RHIFE|nr:hypothetical protein mRhiFer1_003420 [Rhinolophus ferrumequinum]
MKFFVFTCLLAVALAKHKMEDSSSSEESANISQEKFKQETKVVIRPSKERTSSSSSEESAEVPTKNKINQFYQKLKFLQYLQALYQPQIVTNPLDLIKTSAYSFFPTVESASFSQEENPKTADMNKISQYYQKFPVPQYLKTVHQHQTTVKPWNHIKTNAYQIIPTLRYI